MSLCHSQSPLNSVTANLCPDRVRGFPALWRSPPFSGKPGAPTKGLISANAAFKDQQRRLSTTFIVLFLNSKWWGQLKTIHREWRMERGLNNGRLINIETIFSNLYCVHVLAASPWIPTGTCCIVAGLRVAHGSPICLAWHQYSDISLFGNWIFTSSNKYERMRWGCTIGREHTPIPPGFFSSWTGTLIDSISSLWWRAWIP